MMLCCRKSGGLLMAGLLLTWLDMSVAVASAPPPVAERLTPEQTAARIDQLFAESWDAENIVPAPPATDSEFLRRVYLDLAGRIPAVSAAREFLSSAAPDRRGQLVNQLLDSPAYVRNFTIVWRNALIPQAASQLQFRGLIPGFDAWLWRHIADNTPYDQLVREIITAPLDTQPNPAAVLNTASSPEAFFLARELQPENLATGTSRAFLGVRLDCAQCHDHPFDRWKQQQFWNLAAFYADVAPPATDDSTASPAAAADPLPARQIRIPLTGEIVPAVFLTGQQPDWQAGQVSSRTVLAEWITSRNNPWFARMAANRLWAQFFGQGLVQPVDDFSEHNPPSHPQVLDLLAEQFAAHDFNLQFLIRTITATRVYQTGSLQTDASQSDPVQFARAALRGLTPEQFFDSLAEAVGFYQPYRRDNPFVLDENAPRSRFLELYRDDAESPLQRETTILQALAMMNGAFVAEATSLEGSQALRAIADFPLMSDQERLETLFLATLTRTPTAHEQERFTAYLQTGGARGDARTALADVFWVLLNSSEFLLNH